MLQMRKEKTFSFTKLSFKFIYLKIENVENKHIYAVTFLFIARIIKKKSFFLVPLLGIKVAL